MKIEVSRYQFALLHSGIVNCLITVNYEFGVVQMCL
jgi:hypothetical protein